MDRIAEGYGGLLGKQAEENSRKRIDWICSRVKGKCVLDIGCSQGICELLLARQGKYVIGVDCNADALAYARKIIAEETAEVQGRINLWMMDFETQPLPYEIKFDTVVLAEILEHLSEPGIILERAVQQLKDGGTLIATVPFGVNDHPDHKQTFYLNGMLDLLVPLLHVKEVHFMGKWIGFYCVKEDVGSEALKEQKLRLLPTLEREFETIERDLQQRVRKDKNYILDLKEKLGTVQKTCQESQEALRQADAQLAQSRQHTSQLETEIKQIKLDFEACMIQARQQEQELTQEIAHTEEQLNIRTEQLEKAQQREQELTQEIAHTEEQLNIRTEQLEKAQQREQELTQKITHTEEMLNARMAQLEEEQQRERQQVEELCRTKQEHVRQLNGVEEQRRHLEAELDEIKSNVQTVRKRYRVLKKQYDILSESLCGRIQLKIWRLKDRLLYWRKEEKNPLREFLKRIPGLKRLVFLLRGNEAYRGYYLKSVPKAGEKKAQEPVAAVKTVSTKPGAPTPHSLTKTPQTEEKKTPKPAEAGKAADAKPKELAVKKREYYGGRTDEGYFERIRSMVESIPDSNGSRLYTRSQYRIGCVIDEFQFQTYQDTAQWIYLRPDDHEQKIDLLLIVSAWRGIDQAWAGVGNLKRRELRDSLLDLIRHYKAQGKPVVFYSKEDPGNYDVFIEFARECDYIFTSEADCIPNYIRDTGNERVYHLPFSINPVYHNPIGSQKYHLPEIFFAGTWWDYKYPERIKDQRMLISGVLRAGRKLKLVDRNYDSPNMQVAFPEDLLPYVSPSIPHRELQKVHKLYDWGINLNSAKHSSTMFASRVFELQALGCSILSNPSRGMQSYFPDIPVAEREEDVARILDRLPKEQLYEQQMIALRRMMSRETVFDRFDTILQTAGLPRVEYRCRVLVLVENEDTPGLREMFDAQSYADKVLCGLSRLSEKLLEECQCFTFWNEAYQYGPCYLEDMINAFKYTDSDFVTKDAYFDRGVKRPGVEHDYVNTFRDRYKTVFWRTSVAPEQVREGMNLRGYSIDPFQLDVNTAAV